jgi:hypothetical protein
MILYGLTIKALARTILSENSPAPVRHAGETIARRAAPDWRAPAKPVASGMTPSCVTPVARDAPARPLVQVSQEGADAV